MVWYKNVRYLMAIILVWKNKVFALISSNLVKDFKACTKRT